MKTQRHVSCDRRQDRVAFSSVRSGGSPPRRPDREGERRAISLRHRGPFVPRLPRILPPLTVYSRPFPTPLNSHPIVIRTIRRRRLSQTAHFQRNGFRSKRCRWWSRRRMRPRNADPPSGHNESRPCKNVLSDGGAEVETKPRTPPAHALMASISGLVPSTAIPPFML